MYILISLITSISVDEIFMQKCVRMNVIVLMGRTKTNMVRKAY